jgi:glyoxylase-like metal-dependent hydrolase (beta-lactamase superfamily II)
MRFESSSGATIYLMPVETFPGHINNIYLIKAADGAVTLVDAGSQLPSTQKGLAERFQEVAERFGEAIGLDDVERVIVTHAHIDHFGNVHDFRRRGAEIWVHELDARVLENFEERVVIAAKDHDVFLRRAGVADDMRGDLGRMYIASKDFFRSIEVDRRLRNGDELPGGFVVHHVPGHCPGLICLRLGDILLTSDHLLARITPHQMPQSITPFTGLENYLRSLEKIWHLEGIRLALGGHEAPIEDMRGRIEETVAHHTSRLERVVEICSGEPRTLAEVSFALFGEQEGYGRILAFSEAGAHVEHLHLRGELAVANLDEVKDSDHPVIRYTPR